MEPQSNRLEYKVGIFIALGLVAIMFSVLLLGADKAFFTRYVRLHAQFTDVGGLFPGSVVSLAGLPVGAVETMQFVPAANKIDVTLKIDKKFEGRLVTGTKGEIKTQGALGDKFVFLDPGSPTAAPLADGSLIESSEQDFMKMLTSREDGLATVIDLVKEMRVLVASINQNGQTASMVRSFSEAASKLNGLLGDLRGEIPENRKLKSALVSLASILEKIDQGKGTVGQLINDPTVAAGLKSFLGGSPRNRYMKDMIRETLQNSETK